MHLQLSLKSAPFQIMVQNIKYPNVHSFVKASQLRGWVSYIVTAVDQAYLTTSKCHHRIGLKKQAGTQKVKTT